MSSDVQVLLATFGTLGDVLPFVAIAKALQRRGLSPKIATSLMYRSLIEEHDIAFAPMRPDESDLLRDLGIDHATFMERVARSPFFIIDRIYLAYLEQTYADVMAASDGASAMVIHSLLVGAGLAAERRGVPLVRIALSPVLLQSALSPSVTPPVPYIFAPRSTTTRAFNRLLRDALRRRLACKFKPVAQFRSKIGLPASNHDLYLDCGRPGPFDVLIGLFSPAFAPRQVDHPAHTEIVGFPTGNEAEVVEPALRAFLAGGEPPIVFTLGSFAVESPGSFYEASRDAVRRLGRRAVLLTGSRLAPALASLAAQDVFVASYAPHRMLFPKAAAVVHHGGIGTTGEALRSGRPQLVVPFFGDQYDQAARIARLGLGLQIRPKKYDAELATRGLETILRPPFLERAGRFAHSIAGEDGAETAADLIASKLSGSYAARLPKSA